MSFLTIKKFLKKCWTWLKHNWKAPFVVLFVLFTWLVLRRKNVAEQILKIREASFKAQVDAINHAHEEELKKRDAILEEYNKTVSNLEQEFAKNNKELDEKNKKSIKKIVKKYYNDPDTLAKMIGEKFEIEYIENE
jgi:isopentenyl diphosphate isomerase/L-lactate dehydrogenase-like FMN-dependent dehydrogenase